MTSNSFFKLLSEGDLDIFIVKNIDKYSVQVQKVLPGVAPRFATVFTGNEYNALSVYFRVKRDKAESIVIKNNMKRPQDIVLLAKRYQLYREADDEGAFSVIEKYDAKTEEWHECMAFDSAESRMEGVRMIDNNPHALLLYMWGKRSLSATDCHATVSRCLVRDARDGALPDYLDPFLKWKLVEKGAPRFSLQEAEDMYAKVSADLQAYDSKYPCVASDCDGYELDDPWRFTRMYGDDMRIVAYLLIVSDELAALRDSGLLLKLRL